MVCIPPTNGKAAGVTVPGISIVFMALLRSLYPSTTNPNPPEPDFIPAAATNQSECSSTLDTEWQWHCGMEIDIFTENKPEDMFALAALFRKADEMFLALGCSAGQYPIKYVITGGSYDDHTAIDLTDTFLESLNDIGIGHDPLVSNGEKLMEGAPRCGPWQYQRDKAAVDTILEPTNPPSDYSSSAKPSTRYALSHQKSPIVVALRPLPEFAAAYTEAMRRSDPTASNHSAAYESARQRFMDDPDTFHLLDDCTDMLSFFGRARVVMFQGKQSFSRLGLFFSDYILNSFTANTDNAQDIKNLEKAFVEWPKQFLLFDRDGILANEGHQDEYLFTAMSQPEVFLQMSSVASIENIGSIARPSRLLLTYIPAYNQPITDVKVDRVKDMLSTLRDSGAESDRATCLANFAVLEQEATSLASDLARRTQDWEQLMNQVRLWQGKAQAFKAQTSKAITIQLKNYQPGYATPLLVSSAIKPLDSYISWALVRASFVLVSSLLLPFSLETGLPPNLAQESLQYVSYGGRDSDGTYRWEAPWPSDGSVWFTNATASATLGAVGTSAL